MKCMCTMSEPSASNHWRGVSPATPMATVSRPAFTWSLFTSARMWTSSGSVMHRRLSSGRTVSMASVTP